MSESTASRLDRVGREQRREERQKTTTAAASSSTSSSSPVSSNIPQASSGESDNNIDHLRTSHLDEDAEESDLHRSSTASGTVMFK